MTALDRAALDALLRRELRMFIHRAFQTVSPGERYQSAWYIDAIAHQLERYATGQERAEALPGRPRKLEVNRAVGQTFLAPALSDLMAQDRAHRAIGVHDLELLTHRLTVFQCRRGEIQ